MMNTLKVGDKIYFEYIPTIGIGYILELTNDGFFQIGWKSNSVKDSLLKYKTMSKEVEKLIVKYELNSLWNAKPEDFSINRKPFIISRLIENY